MRALLFSWTVAVLIGIAACGWLLLGDTATNSARSQARPTASPSAAKTPPAAVPPSEAGPRIELKLPGAAELAAAAEVVKLDDARQELSGAQYLELRNAERETLRHYGFLFEALPSLPPETRRRLKELLREQELSRRDVTAALIKNGIVPGSPAQAAFTDQMARDFEAQLAAVCGPDLAEVNRLRGLAAPMGAINLEIAPYLEFSGAPLSLAQKLQLAEAMKDIGFMTKRFAAGDQPVDPATGLTPLYRDLVDRAVAFLSPEQLAGFKAAQDYMRALRADLSARGKAGR